MLIKSLLTEKNINPYDWLRYGVEHELEISDIDKLMLEYFRKLTLSQKQALLNLIVEIVKS